MNIVLSKNGVKWAIFKISDVQKTFRCRFLIYHNLPNTTNKVNIMYIVLALYFIERV